MSGLLAFASPVDFQEESLDPPLPRSVRSEANALHSWFATSPGASVKSWPQKPALLYAISNTVELGLTPFVPGVADDRP